MSVAISQFPGELPVDAVGMFQIVPKGRHGYGLAGAELDEFVRRAIYALVDAGAVPVRGQRGSDFVWIAQHQYGVTREQIAEAVIAEWHAMPDDPLVLCGEGVWFARPDPKRPKYVKMD